MTTDKGAVLAATNLDVGYERRAVIRGININALRGQVICLIGPNGSGKSTALRTLCGMLAPINGTVFVDGRDIRKTKPVDLARFMAVVLTERLSVPITTAYEIAAMGRVPYTGFFGRLSEEDRRVVSESMGTVGASALAEREYMSLSDGEKQKVLIARALAQQPQLIILDEPTSHLDVRHKVEVMGILNKLARERGLTVILALHDVDIALKCCQFVMLVKDGAVIAQGKPEDVIGGETISRLYDIDGAFFDALTGSLEVRNARPPDIYVASGAGTGAAVYRLLSRMGLGIATGILGTHDVDCRTAEAMGLTVVSELPFEPISDRSAAIALDHISRARIIVDTGFPIGAYNRVNADILRGAMKPILSLRGPDEITRMYGAAANVTAVPTVGALEEWALLRSFASHA